MFFHLVFLCSVYSFISFTFVCACICRSYVGLNLDFWFSCFSVCKGVLCALQIYNKVYKSNFKIYVNDVSEDREVDIYFLYL